MNTRRKLASAGVLILLVFAGAATAWAMASGKSHHARRYRSVPPAAQALAVHLHVPGTATVGAQPGGQGGPWTIWLTRTTKSVTSGRNGSPRTYSVPAGLALSTGPSGPKGEFHYYDIAAEPTCSSCTHGSKDSFHGQPASRSQAEQIARAWLQSAGTPIPQGSPQVTERAGATIIGGTGLCCFTALNVVSWGGTQDKYGVPESASVVVYVADAGSVVQADVTPGGSSPFELSKPCPGRTSLDANGVARGTWCFDYAGAANLQLTIDIGGHGGWEVDPQHVAWTFARGSKIQGRLQGPLHTVTLTGQQAVYTVQYQGTTYRLTLVPAFPGLTGTVWELVKVEAA